ncbi:hypothetical protein KFL_001530075 [Klebsormidium nitens]|uniref:Uncharacterized protein n=1 Tax=Klebsormidium nitens TaxID=105231 RepID=A0A1Y1HY40_KLENI|nr:hypothetical protein KFL_001530075 [Klebsormidium nitens]|eukprot:GAQ83565.1 hypothetical protein KFL_001530075 [Klebsormidium nitens]
MGRSNGGALLVMGDANDGCPSGTAVLENSVLASNKAQDYGGAVYVGEGGLAYLVSTQFSGNSAGAPAPTSARAGGAVAVQGGRAFFDAAVFTANADQSRGLLPDRSPLRDVIQPGRDVISEYLQAAPLPDDLSLSLPTKFPVTVTADVTNPIAADVSFALSGVIPLSLSLCFASPGDLPRTLSFLSAADVTVPVTADATFAVSFTKPGGIPRALSVCFAVSGGIPRALSFCVAQPGGIPRAVPFFLANAVTSS